MNDAGEQVIEAGGEEDADPREKGGGGDDFAFFAGIGMLLHDGVEGDAVEAAEKAKGTKQGGDGGERDAVTSKQGSGNGQACHAEGDEAIFNFLPGEEAGGKTADAQTDGEGGLQITIMGVVHLEGFTGIGEDDQLEQSAERPKVGIADDAEEEHAIAADGFQIAPKFGEDIGVEFFLRIGGGEGGDAEAQAEAGEGETDEDEAEIGVMSGKQIRKEAGDDGADDDGSEGAETEDAVAPGKFFLREQFGQHAVFGGAKNGAMGAHQKNASEEDGKVILPEAEAGKGHDADLGAFDDVGDVALAKTIGKKTAGHGKENERERE